MLLQLLKTPKLSSTLITQHKDAVINIPDDNRCPYCGSQLIRLWYGNEVYTPILICNTCGAILYDVRYCTK